MHPALFRRRRIIAALLALSLTAAACSSGPVVEEQSREPDPEAGVTDEDPEDGEGLDDGTAPTVPEPVGEAVDEEPVVAADVGVTNDTIRIGYSLDLSGPFSFHDARVLDGHFALFESINESGGIAGRTIEVVALDNEFDVATHLDNVAVLLAEDSGVALLGGLSHPNFDDATVSIASTDLLIVGNTTPTETSTTAVVVPLRASVCAETTAGVAAMVDMTSSAEDEPAQLAIISTVEPWASGSAEVSRRVAEELEVGVLIDAEVEANDDLSELITELVESDVDMVWVAAAPTVGVSLAAVFEQLEESPEWLLSGTDLSFSSAVLNSASRTAFGEVFLRVTSDPLVDSPDLSEVRAALAESAPELTYAEAGPALFGWEQAELIVAVLEQAADSQDLTRSSLAAIGETLAPAPREVVVYQADPLTNLNRTLSMPGESGLEQVFTESDVPNAVSALCS